MHQKFEILDCTLRDGGYYNNWNFNIDKIQKYLDLISKSGIRYSEIGFRFLKDDIHKGQTAFTKESLLSLIKVPKFLNIGVMINASDLLKKEKDPLKICKNLFPNIRKSKINFVRIACHYDEIFYLAECIKWFKKNSIKVFVNIMQISEINKFQLKKILNFLKKKIDHVYFADSLGCLKPNDIKKIIDQFDIGFKFSIGIHAHDNMNLAIKNTLLANKLGVEWLDSTITGMGRGPGNTKTEDLLLEKYGKDVYKKFITSSIFKYFKKLKKKYNWGYNKFYHLGAQKKIHPTYIQKILSDKRYNKNSYHLIIDNLSRVGAIRYNLNKLISTVFFETKNPVGFWSPKTDMANRDILILGAGDNLKKQKHKIEKLISKKNLYVICLNTNKVLNEKFINIRAVSHPFRMISDIIFHKKSRKKIAIPYSMLNTNLKKILQFDKNKILDYGICLNNENKFIIASKFCIIPNTLALTYALSLAVAGKAKSISVAGFDGYENSDVDQDETDQTLNLFSKLFNKNKPICSYTKSKYKNLLNN